MTVGVGAAVGAGVGAGGGAEAVSVKVTNPMHAARPVETIALDLSELRKLAPTLEFNKTVVRDAATAEIESQLVDMDGDEKPDQLVFQAAFAAAETKTFVVEPGQRRPAARTDFKVYGRFVRERPHRPPHVWA